MDEYFDALIFIGSVVMFLLMLREYRIAKKELQKMASEQSKPKFIKW